MNRRTMVTTLAGGVVAAGYARRANAAPAADSKLPVASAEAAKDFPGAKDGRIQPTTTRSCSRSARR